MQSLGREVFRVRGAMARATRFTAPTARAAAAAWLVLLAVFLFGCDDGGSQTGSRWYDAGPVERVTFDGYAADGQTIALRFDRSTMAGECGVFEFEKLAVQWDGADTLDTPVDTLTRVGLPMTGTVRFSAREGGGRVRVRVVAPRWACNPSFGLYDYLYGWSAWIVVPPRAAPAAPPAPTTTVVFAHASPAFAEGTVVDARLSTGPLPLQYAWAPTGTCDDGTYFGDPLPPGRVWLRGGTSATCTVTVTGANGATSSASVSVASGSGGAHNGEITFPGGGVARVTGARNLTIGGTSGYAATTACVDLAGGTSYTTPVTLAGGPPGVGETALTALTPGLHRVAATLWVDSNADCANTTDSGTGYVQTIANLYSVDSAGALAEARSGRRAATYAGRSRLRFVGERLQTAGTTSTDGVVRGLTLTGRFTWQTPAKGGGVQRPAALALLNSGTYVMRANRLIYGPKTNGRTELIGQATLLLRGRGGVLACGTLTSDGAASTFTLIGGTASASRLRATVASPSAATYPLPNPKAKSPTAKPATGAGTVVASTGGRAALPAACSALRRHLP